MGHVKNGPRRMRVLCAYQNQARLKLLETILRSVGGVASHGLCQNHFDEEMAKTHESKGEETQEIEYDPDGGPRRWRLGDLKNDCA